MDLRKKLQRGLKGGLQGRLEERLEGGFEGGFEGAWKVLLSEFEGLESGPLKVPSPRYSRLLLEKFVFFVCFCLFVWFVRFHVSKFREFASLSHSLQIYSFLVRAYWSW